MTHYPTISKLEQSEHLVVISAIYTQNEQVRTEEST